MNTCLAMDTELFQHPLSLKHELNLQWRDPVGRLKIPPRDTDPRSPDEVRRAVSFCQGFWWASSSWLA